MVIQYLKLHILRITRTVLLSTGTLTPWPRSRAMFPIFLSSQTCGEHVCWIGNLRCYELKTINYRNYRTIVFIVTFLGIPGLLEPVDTSDPADSCLCLRPGDTPGDTGSSELLDRLLLWREPCGRPSLEDFLQHKYFERRYKTMQHFVCKHNSRKKDKDLQKECKK